MGLTKYASFRVLSARMAQGGQRLLKNAHRVEFDYEPRPGFLYVRSRAISSRCNDNYDEFPAEEIRKAYKSFIGKPVFVNHANDDHRRARGVIVDAALHEDVNPDKSQDTWVEVLMEVDATSYPKLAQAILAGHIDRTSMGTDVAYSQCSYCGNKASSPLEYCSHIPAQKGQRIRRTTASGKKEDVLVREICMGLHFFENSLLVEPPADPTAYTLGVDTRGLDMNPRAARLDRGDDSLRHAAGTRGDYLSPFKDEPRIPRSAEPQPSGAWQPYSDFTAGDPTEQWQQGYLDASQGRPKAAFATVDYFDGYEYGRQLLMLDHEPMALDAKQAARPQPPRIEWKHLPAQGRYDTEVWSAEVPSDDVISRGTLLVSYDDWAGGQWGWEVNASEAHGNDDAGREGVAMSVEQAKADAEQAILSIWQQWADRVDWDTSATSEPFALPWHYHRSKAASRHEAANYDHMFDVPVGQVEVGDMVALAKDDDPADFVKKVGEWGDRLVLHLVHEGAERQVQVKADERIARVKRLLQARKRAVEETSLPEEVDTLREEFCPVCGEADSFSGDECAVCGYTKPPEEFTDPDLAKAKDLKEEREKAKDAGEDDADDDEDDDQQTTTSRRNTAAGPSSRRSMSMSPALKALAAHQKTIEAQNQRIAALHEALRLVVSLAGVERHPKIASLLKQADVDNPAQPVPAGASEAPPEDTEEVLGDVQRGQPSGGGQTDDLFAPGNTSETRTAPDASTNVTDVGEVLDTGDGIMQNQDVTSPVSGTEGQRPLDEVKIETDVRVDDGVKTDTAFPLEEGFREERKTTGHRRKRQAKGDKDDLPEEFKEHIGDVVEDDDDDDDDEKGGKSEARMFASLRLARLRIQAGITNETDDLALSTSIAHSKTSNAEIQREIDTLAKVTEAKKQKQPRPRHLVPTSASAGQGDRHMPSLQQPPMSSTAAADDTDDSAIFE